jgi:hypothetical protein
MSNDKSDSYGGSEEVMRVKDLVEKLQGEDPNAIVTYWDDVHEGFVPVVADNIMREFIKIDKHDMVLEYSENPKAGHVAAVRIQ